jgi:hypothetical protein
VCVVCVCVCVGGCGFCIRSCVCVCVCVLCVCNFLFFNFILCMSAQMDACMLVYQMAALEELFVHRCVVLTLEVQCSPLHNILDVTALGMLSDLL